MPFDCPNPCITCPDGSDPNNPLLNLTSEAPDVDNFIGRSYNNQDPPLGQLFYSIGCLGVFVASTQELADQGAQRQMMICNSSNYPITTVNPNYNPNNPNSEPTQTTNRPIYGNTEQTCTQLCGNGTQNTRTIAANTYYAFSQATANETAYSAACSKARLTMICLSNLASSAICQNDEASLSIEATGSFGLCTFTVIAGAIPDGMSIVQDADNGIQITGTPTDIFDYTFTIKCVDEDGNICTNNYSLSVVGIATASPLAAGTVGSPYSATITAPSITGTIMWSVLNIPDGLTISSGGVISGTPTTAGAATFTVYASNGTVACGKEFSVTFAAAGCQFNGITWDPVTINNVATGSAAGGQLTGTADATPGAPWESSAVFNGSFTYTGGAYSGTVLIAATTLSGNNAYAEVIITSSVDGILLSDSITEVDGAGNYYFPFVIPASAGATITVQCTIRGGFVDLPGGTGSADVAIDLCSECLVNDLTWPDFNNYELIASWVGTAAGVGATVNGTMTTNDGGYGATTLDSSSAVIDVSQHDFEATVTVSNLAGIDAIIEFNVRVYDDDYPGGVLVSDVSDFLETDGVVVLPFSVSGITKMRIQCAFNGVGGGPAKTADIQFDIACV